jgi:hypothetical protein
LDAPKIKLTGDRFTLRKLPHILLGLTLSSLLLPLHAQQPTLQSLLARLAAQAAALDHSLPNFGCTETAISQELQLGKKPGKEKVIRRVDFTGLIRVRHVTDSPDIKLAESLEYTTVNGKPFTGGGFTMPAYSQGGFRNALGFFAPETQPCYRYSLSPGRIDFEGVADLTKYPNCKSAGTRGFALFDTDGNITHLERRVMELAAYKYHLTPFAAIDLASVTLNGTTYRLTHHLLAEIPNGRSLDRFEADFTDCRLFTATVTVGPATEPSDATPPQ